MLRSDGLTLNAQRCPPDPARIPTQRCRDDACPATTDEPAELGLALVGRGDTERAEPETAHTRQAEEAWARAMVSQTVKDGASRRFALKRGKPDRLAIKDWCAARARRRA